MFNARFAANLVFTLACALAYDMAHAGQFYLDAGIGATHFTCTICSDDGTWVQTGLPNSMTMNSLSWKLGLGYRVNERWSVGLSYLNMGTAKIRQDYTVSDQQYNPKQHTCLAPCTNVGPFHTHDLMEGVELTASYHWRQWPIQPYLKVGAAGLYHRLTVQYNGMTFYGQDGKPFNGWIYSSVIGGGLEYGWLYVDATYYRGLGGATDWSAGLPISKEQVVGFVGIRIPLPY